MTTPALPVKAFRKINLRRYIDANGGPGVVGASLGYSNSSFLVQMTGPSPNRYVSEKTARGYELKLGLEPGYFDMPVEVSASELLMLEGIQSAQVQSENTFDPKALEQYHLLMEMVGGMCVDAKITFPVPQFMLLMRQVTHIALSLKRVPTKEDIKPLLDLISS